MWRASSRPQPSYMLLPQAQHRQPHPTRLPRSPVPRLTILRPRLSTADTRKLRPPPKTADPHYLTPAHRQWRTDVLRRANYTCERCGTKNVKFYADHIVEIKDGGSATDIGNGQCLCSPCHGIKTARMRGERAITRGGATHPEWLRPSRIPLHIVCGAPASGKNAYVASHAGPDDVVIDLDEIASRLSGLPLHGWGREWLDAALRERNDTLGKLTRPSQWRRAWLIVQEPTALKREWWYAKLNPAAIIVIETSLAICLDRIRADTERPPTHLAAAQRWWANYSLRNGDLRIDASPQTMAARPSPQGMGV
jgi:hypothetical protein